MNTFCEHHKNSIKFGYRCFDRILLNGLIQPFQQPERRYRLRPQGYSICVLFLKLFERIYAPLTAGLLRPFRADTILQDTKRSQRDRLYARVAASLDKLLQPVGLKAA